MANASNDWNNLDGVGADVHVSLGNVSGSYFPMCLSGDGWSINFQSKPSMKIIRRGRMPTREELLDVCSFMPGAPAWFVQILEIVVATTPATE